MKTDTIAIVLLGVGGILLYSAIRNLNPLDVIKGALKGKLISAGGKTDISKGGVNKSEGSGSSSSKKNQSSGSGGASSLDNYAKGVV